MRNNKRQAEKPQEEERKEGYPAMEVLKAITKIRAKVNNKTTREGYYAVHCFMSS